MPVFSVTMDRKAAIEAAKGGQVEYRVEKAGIIHAVAGKASFEEEAILENVRALVGAVLKAKPSGAKGKYVRSVTVASTMGPGIRVDSSSLETLETAAT